MLVWVGCSALGAAWGEGPQPPQLTRLEVNGRAVPVESSAKGASSAVRIPSGRVTVQFGPGPGGAGAARRFRYKLEGEGRDDGWCEWSPVMRLVVVFFDAQNDWLAESPFLVTGESPGWSGDLNTSPLLARREIVTVPERAARFSVMLSSAGPPAAVGTVAIGALTVSKTGADKAESKPVLELAFPPEDAEAPAAAGPRGWIRSGTRPSMAQLLRCEDAPAGRVIAIIDEDAKNHAEWQSVRLPVGAGAGAALQIDWRSCFSIGYAEASTVVYDRLQPGHYVLRINEVSLAGRPTDVETSVSLTVNAPFWQKAWFLVLCGMVIAALVLGTSRYFEWRRTQREITRLRQQHALETERARIARDIHDDLGATLTHISMLSQPAAPESSSFMELADNLARINHAAHVMTQAMDEIVWAVNPRNDRLDHLVTFFDAYAQEFLAAAGIEFRCDFPEPVLERPVSAPARHNLFLAFKEALANAARHAACRTVNVGMTVSADNLSLSLTDDGKGFAETSEVCTGNGLANMRRRLEELGGRCTVESLPSRGTKIVFELPLEG